MTVRRGVVFAIGILLFNARPLCAQDLAAGKSGRELYAANCSSCHRSVQTLARRMDGYVLSSYALYSFLREHYTSSRAMAAEVTAYLVAVSSKPSEGRSRPRTMGSTRPATSSAPARPRPTIGLGSAPPRPPADVPRR
jgi:hypothetical protein